MKKWLVTLLGISVSAIAIGYILTHTELRHTATLIADAGFRLPLALIAIYLCTFPIRAQRWQWMLPKGTLRFSQALKGVVLGYAGNNFLPARGGEFLRMEYLYRSAPHIGRVTALASIGVERMLDGLTLLAILVLAISSSHIAMADHAWLGELRYLGLAIFGLAFAGAVVIRIWGTSLAHLLRRTHMKPFNWAARMIERFHVATLFLGFNWHTAAAIVAGMVVWIVEGSVYVAACWYYGLGPQSIVAGYLTMAVVGFGVIVPSSPGNVGVLQYMTILALGLFGVSDERALAMSVVIHACQYVPVTGWGLAILFHESWLWRKRREIEAMDADAEDATTAATGEMPVESVTSAKRPPFRRSTKKQPLTRRK